jgi:hypothetical protein
LTRERFRDTTESFLSRRQRGGDRHAPAKLFGMAVTRVTERFDFTGGTPGGTDAAPVVVGVLACGAVSRNRRRYLKEAFAGERVKRYNGIPVKVTTTHGEPNGNYHEEIGTTQNARHREDGMPLVDILLNPEKPYAKAFFWDSVNNPRACSMSHVADVKKTRAADGWDEVTEVVEALSLDVIGAGRAGTTKGIRESTGSRAVTTLRAVLEAHRALLPAERQPAARKLLLVSEEHAPTAALLDAEIEEPTATEAAEAVDEAVRASMHAALDTLVAENHPRAEFLARMDLLHKTRAQLAGTVEEPAAAVAAGQPDYPALLKECRAEAFQPTDIDLKSLSALTAEERKDYIRDRKRVSEAEDPRSVSRDRSQKTLPQRKPAAKVSWD